jgi:hypothetical protein
MSRACSIHDKVEKSVKKLVGKLERQRRMRSSGMRRRVDLVWSDVSEERGCSHLLTLVPRSWIFPPWRWRWCVPPKRRFTQDLHGATSQKTTFFIVTAVKTSNLTLKHKSPLLRTKRGWGDCIKIVLNAMAYECISGFGWYRIWTNGRFVWWYF